MANKRFAIEDLLAEKQAFLEIPPFLAQQVHFTEAQIPRTRDIAEVRIQAEHAIGRLIFISLIGFCLYL